MRTIARSWIGRRKTISLSSHTTLTLARVWLSPATLAPAVFQVRTQDVLPDRIAAIVINTIRQHETDLIAGALIVLDRVRARLRLLPLQRAGP